MKYLASGAVKVNFSRYLKNRVYGAACAAIRGLERKAKDSAEEGIECSAYLGRCRVNLVCG